MSWLKLALILFNLASSLMEFLVRRRLISEAEIALLAKQKELFNERVIAALNARADVRDDPDSVRDDPYNRD